MLKYSFVWNNYGNSYIVRLEDGRTVLVNTKDNDIWVQQEAVLIQQGMWKNITENDVVKEEYEKISAILENHKDML